MPQQIGVYEPDHEQPENSPVVDPCAERTRAAWSIASMRCVPATGAEGVSVRVLAEPMGGRVSGTYARFRTLFLTSARPLRPKLSC